MAWRCSPSFRVLPSPRVARRGAAQCAARIVIATVDSALNSATATTNGCCAPGPVAPRRVRFLNSVRCGMSNSRVPLVLGTLVLALATSLTGRLLQLQNQQVLDALSDIRQLLEKSSPVNDHVTLTSVGGDSLGSADAPLTMVEFTDLQCPYCRQFHMTTFEQIKKAYIDTGKVRYVSRDFPLDTLHPLAVAAARATRCAGEESKSWEMRHAILVSNANLRQDIFVDLARDLRLDIGVFKRCVDDTIQADAVWRKAK